MRMRRDEVEPAQLSAFGDGLDNLKRSLAISQANHRKGVETYSCHVGRFRRVVVGEVCRGGKNSADGWTNVKTKMRECPEQKRECI
jgi:hypothetical protein